MHARWNDRLWALTQRHISSLFSWSYIIQEGAHNKQIKSDILVMVWGESSATIAKAKRTSGQWIYVDWEGERCLQIIACRWRTGIKDESELTSKYQPGPRLLGFRYQAHSRWWLTGAYFLKKEKASSLS